MGGHSSGGTPLPIPNREVKPARADGTRGASPRESRSPPISFEAAERRPRRFYDRNTELTDRVVRLRRFRDEDAPAVARACADPELSRYTLNIPSPYTLADARTYLNDCDRAWRDGSGRCAFAVVDAGTDELLGAIDVRLGEVGSIGYWVAAEARGRGVATRALRLLSRWALAEQGVERLELTTHVDNIASQRVAEKAGFVREGILRSHARFREGRRDSVLFSLLPDDL